MSEHANGGAAAPNKEDRLLHQLQTQQRQGCARARQLMDDYRDFFDAGPQAVSEEA